MSLGGAVTDEGLKHIQGLSQTARARLVGYRDHRRGTAGPSGIGHLERLSLRHNEISDAGLNTSKGLTPKETRPGYTKVTDAGLEHLKPLSGLATYTS